MNAVQRTVDGTKRPPLVRGRIRNLFRRLRDSIRWYERLHREHGAIVRYRLLHLEICVLFDAELIRQVFEDQRGAFDKGRLIRQTRGVSNPTVVTASGAEHRRRRRLIQPFFHKEALDRYVSTMIDKTAARRDAWREGVVMDLYPETRRIMTDITIDVFFGNEIAIDARDLETVREYVRWDAAMTMLPGGRVIERLPWPRLRRLRRAGAVIDAKLRNAIRRASGAGPGGVDLVSLFIHARDENGERAFSDEEVRDETLALLVVSQGTLNTSLQWCFYHLGRNPAVRARMIEEIDAVLQGRPATPDDFADLVYTRAVFDETLRLCPTMFFVPKTAIRDVVLGGYFLPEGADVEICWLGPHKDQRYFPEPDRFLPERWLKDAPERPKYAYGPFGRGSRSCPAELYAAMTAVYVLATVTQRWRLDLASDRPTRYSSLITYTISGGLPVIPVARTDGPEPVRPAEVGDGQSPARLAKSLS